MESQSSKIHSTVPVIATDDITKTLAYYTQVLGFDFDFIYGDPPAYAGVRSGDAEIYFTYSPELTKAIKGLNPDVFIWVPDADSLYIEHKTRGADIIEQIENRPWSARQYVVRDINGYHLKFAQPL